MERLTAAERSALSPQAYLEQSHVLMFLEDAITEALAAHANGAVDSPVHGIAQYFASG